MTTNFTDGAATRSPLSSIKDSKPLFEDPVYIFLISFNLQWKMNYFVIT